MNWMIASDLHGSAAWCRRLLEAYRQSGAEHLLLLGDLLYHGPRNPLTEEYDPVAVAAMLNERKEEIICVRGNCDSEVDQMVLDFPLLENFAGMHTGGHMIYAAHGHHYGPDNPPPLRKGDYLLCGHFHLPVCENKGGFTYLNPGSLALPKDGTPHSYMMAKGGTFSWWNLATGEEFTPLSEQK